jgi:hypothetical protein
MPKTEPSSSIPPLYGATKRQPWKLLVVPGVLGVVVVSLIVVAIARSGHPRTAAAAAHHRTAPLAGSAGGAATTATTSSHTTPTTASPKSSSSSSPPVASGATTPIGYVSKPFSTPTAALASVGVPSTYPPIEIVPVPGGQGKWAIEPEAIKVQGHDELSMAWTIPDGKWEAWTTTFPGGAPSGVPFALFDAANIGYNLHEGTHLPGPASGTVPWDSVTGQVSRPRGWWVNYSPPTSNQQASVMFTVWTQEEGSSVFHGAYGIIVNFDAQNLTTGDNSISLIQPSTTPATTLAKQATCHPPGLPAECTSAPA